MPLHHLPDDASVAEVLATHPPFSQPVWRSGGGGELARDFVAACMRANPAQRPTAAAALEHRWLARGRATDEEWPRWPPETGLSAFASKMRRATAFAAKEGGGALSRGLGGMSGLGSSMGSDFWSQFRNADNVEFVCGNGGADASMPSSDGFDYCADNSKCPCSSYS